MFDGRILFGSVGIQVDCIEGLRICCIHVVVFIMTKIKYNKFPLHHIQMHHFIFCFTKYGKNQIQIRQKRTILLSLYFNQFTHKPNVHLPWPQEQKFKPNVWISPVLAIFSSMLKLSIVGSFGNLTAPPIWWWSLLAGDVKNINKSNNTSYLKQ